MPPLPYPVATAGNSPRYNSAGSYLDAGGELEAESCIRADSENKVSISCEPPVWTVRLQRQAVENTCLGKKKSSLSEFIGVSD